MSRGVIQPSQQKLAEKLTILNDRGIGMLTRVYNIKKVSRYRHDQLKYSNKESTVVDIVVAYVGDSMNVWLAWQWSLIVTRLDIFPEEYYSEAF